MKKSFTLIAAAVMAFAANAQDLIVPTNSLNPNIDLTECRMDPVGMNVGNVGTESVIGIGEVDFSENYQAVGMAFSNGWNGKGNYAILWAGEDFESALPFAQLALARTGDSYHNYVKLAGNMGYLVSSPADLPGGELAVEGLSFYQPTGKQNVYVTFVGGGGNVQAIHFYKNTFSPADFHSEGGWEPLNGQLLRPVENMSNYVKVAMRLAYENSQLVTSPSPDTRKDGNGGWGWTQEGVVVDYGTMNFGNGEYTQVCGFVSHWNGNCMNDGLEVYIDEVNDENKIAFIFTGNEYHGDFQGELYARAAALNRVVTGSHKVLVKWRGGSTNLTNLDFCKGTLWCESPAPDYAVLAKVNDTPSENAKHYTMRNDVPEGAIKITNHAGLNQYQLEGNGNYGYTGNRTVLKLEGIDFENGQYNKVRIAYATGGDGWIDYKENANISLYLDLEEGGKTYDWTNAPEELKNAGVEPVAVVRHQATGGWGNVLTISDDLAPVTGVHTVYVVYYQRYTSEGANIFDYYLDTEAPAKEPKVTGISIKGEELALEEGVYNYSLNLTEEFTTDDVVVTTEDAEDLVLTITKEDAPLKEVSEYVVTVELQTVDGAPVVSYTVNVTVDTTTGINDINVVNAKAYKAIENGQVVIVKGDNKYNVLGQPVK